MPNNRNAVNPRLGVSAKSASEPWLQELEESFVSVDGLRDFLALRGALELPSTGPSLLVPRSFALRMKPGDSNDPLLMQVLPRPEEDATREGFSADPVGDEKAEIVPGLLKKYRSRALILSSPRCAVSCRFCFRRNTLANRTLGSGVDLGAVLKALQVMTDIDEVILSGGDPLMRRDAELGEILRSLDSMSHIRCIRFHSRMVTVLPSRVQPSLTELLGETKARVVFVLHVNHPNELDDETAHVIGLLREANTVVLNQSVLLRGVNDNAGTLVALSRKLMEQDVLPYYLHQLDRAAGTHHFEVPVERGLALMEEMRAECPGYLVPRYVKEVEGEPFKTPLNR